MKIALFVISLVLANNFLASAQNLINPSGKFESADDLAGLPHYTTKDDVEGTPMLMEDWGNGIVKLKDGRVFKDVILKLNLVSNELYFQRGENMFVFKEPVQDCELNYMQDDVIKKIYLRSGYPDFANRSGNSLYEVLADGKKVQYLKYTYKKIKEASSYGGVPTKSYEIITTYYLYDVKAKQLNKIKPDKSSVLEALPLYAKKIEDFSITNRYKFKSDAEIMALVNELNK